MTVNSDFVSDVQKSGVTDKSADIYFICRSGVSSANAAKVLNQAGYENCFNIKEGFEGVIDNNGHRGKINGWKAMNLPWYQK